jgi:hypothetical protein
MENDDARFVHSKIFGVPDESSSAWLQQTRLSYKPVEQWSSSPLEDARERGTMRELLLRCRRPYLGEVKERRWPRTADPEQ